MRSRCRYTVCNEERTVPHHVTVNRRSERRTIMTHAENYVANYTGYTRGSVVRASMR